MAEIDLDNPDPFDPIILQMALDDYEVTDEAAFYAMDADQRKAVSRWLSARHMCASDHIVSRKAMIQPPFAEAFINHKRRP